MCWQPDREAEASLMRSMLRDMYTEFEKIVSDSMDDQPVEEKQLEEWFWEEIRARMDELKQERLAVKHEK